MHKVLVLDDEKKALVLAQKFLAKEGYEIITSTDPMEALEIVQSNGPISVVLTDERMPGMRGTEFLEKAKGLSPDTTRVLMTGHYDKELLAHAVNKGEIFRFIQKPMNMDKVKEIIRDGISEFETRINSASLSSTVNKLAKEKNELASAREGMEVQISWLKKSRTLLSLLFVGVVVLGVVGFGGYKYFSEKSRLDALEDSKEIIGPWIKYSNGVAKDTRTGLMWMTQDYRGIEKSQPIGWKEAMDWVDKINRERYAGYNDWRAPTIAEYEAIYNPKRSKLAYDKKTKYPVGYPDVFEDGGGYGFWSSQQEGLDQARYFFFIGGYDRSEYISYDNPAMSVRLVRFAGKPSS